ncbi:hypothetical protein ACLKA7_004410 [Drosophila subpalustris]
MKLILFGLLITILAVQYSEQAGIIQRHKRHWIPQEETIEDNNYDDSVPESEEVDDAASETVTESKPESEEVNDENIDDEILALLIEPTSDSEEVNTGNKDDNMKKLPNDGILALLTEPTSESEEVNTGNKDDNIKKLLNVKFEKLEQKLEEKSEKLEEHFQLLDENLQEKYEDLRKTIVDAKIKELTKFEKIGLKYYHIEDTEKLNWFEAANSCREMGANLASPKNEEEFNAVSKRLSSFPYWLGINDLGSEGVFKSTISGKVAEYVKWHKGEPNNINGGEHCVDLEWTGGNRAMNDNDCRAKLNFICEKNHLM